MELHFLPSCDDPRLEPYMNLRERTLRGERIFIAEGDLVVERLLDSRYEVDSLLVSDRAKDRIFPMLEKKLPERVPVYVVPCEGVQALVGFPFHQGVMAAGRRADVWCLKDLMPLEEPQKQRSKLRRGIVVLPDITKPDNVGVVFRNAAALGADGVLLGPQACDPLSRRGLRVSMGGVLQLPWLQTDDLNRDLEILRNDFQYTIYATILDPGATELREVSWKTRLAICFGNEYDGLKPDTLEHCDVRVTIPMACGVDSLNLGVSSGIFLYEALQGRSEP